MDGSGGQDCPRAGIGRNDGARVLTRSNARRHKRRRKAKQRVRVCWWAVGRLLVFVRCCGQDCPRAGIGRNDGARVSTRSNARRRKRGAERPDGACACCAGLSDASWFSCVAADKTVRAPGLAAMTERGFQPAATPEGQEGRERPNGACACGGLFGRLLVFVRCCGQDCPRAGIGRNDGARVSTRSNARRARGVRKAKACARVLAGCRTPLGFRALLRTRLSARREWPQ